MTQNRHDPTKITPQEVAQYWGFASFEELIQRLYVDGGLSLKELGKKLNLSSAWLSNMCRRLRIKIRRRGRTMKFIGIPPEDILRLSTPALSKLYDISEATVYRYRRRLKKALRTHYDENTTK